MKTAFEIVVAVKRSLLGKTVLSVEALGRHGIFSFYYFISI
jgi:hypothetical protein